MAITDNANALIDGEDVAATRTRTVVDPATGEPPVAASAWTRDVFRAQRAARKLEAGTVWIDEHLAIGSEMPHGGVKGSGFGKDMSMYALEEYTVVKHVVYELTGAPRKDWYDAVSSR
jgi:betaine-aldehyde dehydrogenase